MNRITAASATALLAAVLAPAAEAWAAGASTAASSAVEFRRHLDPCRSRDAD